MPYVKLNWTDPTNLVYEGIKVYAAVNAGNPVDPANFLTDVAMGVEEWIDPNVYLATDRVCYGVKSFVTTYIGATPYVLKSPFSTYVCVTLGAMTPGAVAALAQAFAATMSTEGSDTLVAFVRFAIASAFPATMSPGAVTLQTGTRVATASAFPATMSATETGAFITETGGGVITEIGGGRITETP